MSSLPNFSGEAATLLVVDGDARARRQLQRAFEREGHRVVACADAAEALRELHRQACDLAVVNVELPGVGGLALCRLLRAQAATRRLPVVIVSSEDTEQQKVEAFAAGADDFVAKPAGSRELADARRRAPRSRRARARARRQQPRAEFPGRPRAGLAARLESGGGRAPRRGRDLRGRERRAVRRRARPGAGEEGAGRGGRRARGRRSACSTARAAPKRTPR